jgi:hypothetical protein
MVNGKDKTIPLIGLEGSHILYKIGSQMAMKLSVSLTRRPPFTPRKVLVLISVTGLVEPRTMVKVSRDKF